MLKRDMIQDSEQKCVCNVYVVTLHMHYTYTFAYMQCVYVNMQFGL